MANSFSGFKSDGTYVGHNVEKAIQFVPSSTDSGTIDPKVQTVW